ncbi:MAG: polyketide cyclase, partial [Saprospiraceae bacterium]
DKNQLQTSLFPLLILLVFGKIEHWMTLPPEVASVTTRLEFPFSAEQVFDEVKAMDTLDAEKPLLLQVGLPTPYKCVLEADSVGAKRICVFPDGRIVSQLTEFDRPNSFKMNVLEYSLTGLRWFRFESASYALTQKGDTTQLSRTTSYSSTLKPRLYWQPLEIWAIEQEHRFVLESVKKNLMKQKTTRPAHN